jgi:1,4-alpha-glucan branching enzyme
VVHLKGSLYTKMAGDDWQKRANLRLLFGYMFGLPGKKLLFMGCEFGQPSEWNHDRSLDWHLLAEPGHQGIARWVSDLNRLYREQPALWQLDCEPRGFTWLDPDDAALGVLSFLRHGERPEETLLLVCNFTPLARDGYRLGVPAAGRWVELMSSDATEYGGSGLGNRGGQDAQLVPCHHQPASLEALLPPLGIVIFRRQPAAAEPLPSC